GKLVGNAGELGIDQQVRSRRIERQGHAVGLDGDALLRRMAVVARTAGADPVGRNLLRTFDQQEPVGDRNEGLEVVLLPGRQRLVTLRK
ncbi:MAG: hypothetical protein ABSE84_09985, partial [Isosphaeraceae bacterium]